MTPLEALTLTFLTGMFAGWLLPKLVDEYRRVNR